MYLVLHLPERLEEALKREAAKSGVDLETVVLEAVESRVALKTTKPPKRRKLPREEFERKLRQAVSMLPGTSHFVDDSRDAIYSRKEVLHPTGNQ